ncbi:adenylyl-sulfate kinase [uncultured Leifsonia sp.]|uniref:nucleotide-binding protein n=1 Tax=uncultured Leifsonia sp. TaxID=340359 RepID=UPI0028D36BE8|nr:adenylyl-sulfate kinase [uncultured Leifsonia sp.]
MDADLQTEVLFIGGRSGVGKSTVAAEVSHLLASATVKHALIEGDNLDQAYPAPWREGIDLAEQNLAAMWKNYRRAGYRRLIYTNTVSVLQMEPLVAALGGTVRSVGVLLTASDESARSRLALREIGSAFDEHVQRSAAAARKLEAEAGPAVHRVDTDGRTINQIARDVVALTGWPEPSGHSA